MSWAEHMAAAGFATDPVGDAARREELTSAGLDEVAALLSGGGTAPPPDPREHPPVPGHLLTFRHSKSGTEVTCECGRWDGWYNGPRSRRRVLDDHAEHAAAELRAAGPIIVEAVRTDQEEP